MKVCFKCGIGKSLNNFYKHKQMGDGHLNKCIDCTKNDVRKRETEKLKSDPEWIEKERARHRGKYYRLGYKEKQLEWNKDKPWTKSNIYKGLSKKFKIDDGLELHHWCYSDEFLKNVFVMTRSEHKKAHKYLIFDLDVLVFKTLDHDYLLTKDEHFKYLQNCGIKFISYQPNLPLKQHNYRLSQFQN